MSGVSSAITRYFSYYVDSARSHIINCLDRCFDPKAAAFYAELVLRGYDPNAHVDVLPQSRLIYVCIPKCASTTIKATYQGVSGSTLLTVSPATLVSIVITPPNPSIAVSSAWLTAGALPRNDT